MSVENMFWLAFVSHRTDWDRRKEAKGKKAHPKKITHTHTNQTDFHWFWPRIVNRLLRLHYPAAIAICCLTLDCPASAGNHIIFQKNPLTLALVEVKTCIPQGEKKMLLILFVMRFRCPGACSCRLLVGCKRSSMRLVLYIHNSRMADDDVALSGRCQSPIRFRVWKPPYRTLKWAAAEAHRVALFCGLILYLLRTYISHSLFCFPGSGTRDRPLPNEEAERKHLQFVFFLHAKIREYVCVCVRCAYAVAGRTKTAGRHANDYFITALKYNMLVMLFMTGVFIFRDEVAAANG